MVNYEVAYILDPNLSEEALAALTEKFSEQVRTLGGEIVGVDSWGKKRLAYVINGFNEGFYVIMRFKATSEGAAELGRVMKLTDGMIKSMMLRSN
jgi:small subunit ribosomal protein S6